MVEQEIQEAHFHNKYKFSKQQVIDQLEIEVSEVRALTLSIR